MRVIVCGSRSWTDAKAIRNRLSGLHPMRDTIVHGNCHGADKIADDQARSMDFAVEKFPADWQKLGFAAGPIRNQKMADAGADLCIAFRMPGKSNGTDDMIAKAKAAGIPVEVISP